MLNTCMCSTFFTQVFHHSQNQLVTLHFTWNAITQLRLYDANQSLFIRGYLPAISLHRGRHCCSGKSSLQASDWVIIDYHRVLTRYQGPISIWRPSFRGMGIPMLKIRRLQDRLIFNKGIPILERRHLYIEMTPRRHFLSTMYWITVICK